MGTYKVTNSERGARGFYNAAGGLVMLEPNQTSDSVEVSDAEAKSAAAVGLQFNAAGKVKDDAPDETKRKA